MKSTTVAYTSFAVITAIYFILNDAMKSVGSVNTAKFYLYIFTVISIQSLINSTILVENNCKYPLSMSFYIGVGILYWILIFMVIAFLIEYFDGWKGCFSNTFGFMVVSLMGAKEQIDVFFDEIMSGTGYSINDKKEIFNMIYRDRSLILNELTPSNMKNLVEMMVGTTGHKQIITDPNFNNYTYEKIINDTQKAAVNNMESILHRKDNVARFMWYILAGCTAISFTHSLIMTPKCDVSVEQIKKTATESYNKVVEAKGRVDDITKKPLPLPNAGLL